LGGVYLNEGEIFIADCIENEVKENHRNSGNIPDFRWNFLLYGLENPSQSGMMKLTKAVKPEQSEGGQMNERFMELPEEKQAAILNAAMEVFAKNEYKKASTDLIAAKAGVSKGLLFYYFHNKKELYLAVYEYAKRLITEAVVDEALLEITDFFDLITQASIRKMELLRRHPYITQFSVRSYYSEKEDISEEMKAATTQGVDDNWNLYFDKVDLSKFKEGVDPLHIYKMLVWMTDGYLHERQMQGKAIDPDEIETEFYSWVDMLKRITYREVNL
jgi:AcrR family transcriptional regulator